MFDGNFKSKRTINLGGNKQQVDKQKLLRQAQEERRVREAERARLRSAERIQAWYRGRTTAAKVRQGVRNTWDQDMSQLEQYLGASSTASELASNSIERISQAAEKAVQQFLLFFRPRWDHQRLVQLCRMLLSRLPHENAHTKLAIAPFRSTDKSNSWTLQLQRLLPILVDHLGVYSGWSEEEAGPVINLLDVTTLPDSFHPVKDPQDSIQLAKGFAKVVVSSSIFAQIARYQSQISLEEKNRLSVATSLLLAIRICKVLESPHVLDGFISHILTIPLLPNRMAIDALATFTSRLPLDTILLQLSSTSCAVVEALPRFKVTPLLANILAFAYQRVSKMSPVISGAYLRTLTILLGMIPANSIEVSSALLRDEDEDSDDFEWRSEALPGSAMAAGGSTTVDPKMSKWLALAHNNDHLNDILASVDTPKAAGESQPVLSAESVGQITQLLLNLITLFPSHKINILSNLMYFRFGAKSKQTFGTGNGSPTSVGGKFFGTSIIKIFLDAFMATPLYDQLLRAMQKDTQLSIQLVLELQHAYAWSLLAFIAELYCQILVTMGDDEFHDNARNPIELSIVVTLASVVRDISFLLWWNDNALNMEANLGGSKNLRVGYLRDIVTKLTRQLHARDSRRPFCPKDHWLLSMPLDMPAFKRAVILDEESLSRDQDQDDQEGEDTLMRDPQSARGQRSISRRLKSLQLARLSPRLGVLNNIPFVIRFEDRVSIFRAFVESDRQKLPGAGFHPMAVGHAQVHRGSVFEDGYEHLNHLGSKLKGRIAISFIDQYGMTEAGIDGGGVFKEFLTSLVLQAFDSNYGLFKSTSDQLLYPNPHGFSRETTQLKHYEFLGRILGKALYEGILIDAAFAGFFLAKCLGQVNYLDDLPSLDPDLYRGLMFLKNYEGNVEDLSLYFTVDDEEMGSTITRDLIPNGSNTLVTRQNRIRYIYLTAHYRLNTQIDRQCKAFFRGLSDLIDPKWLWMFNQQELQVMMGGAQTGISLKDLAQNVVYSNFEPSDPTIEYFWSVVQEMSEDDRRLLIKFVTSCARPPLLGFAELNPKLCIRNAGQEEDRLPTSSTCMNLLKLPAYTSRQRLKEKLSYAIHSEAGFDLS